jgi:hypothetical protein
MLWSPFGAGREDGGGGGGGVRLRNHLLALLCGTEHVQFRPKKVPRKPREALRAGVNSRSTRGNHPSWPFPAGNTAATVREAEVTVCD